MMKILKYISSVCLLIMMVFVSCQDEDQEFGAIISPTNISISAEIVGADTNNPNGDGSGTVHFTATADNATGFKFVINNNEFTSPTGRLTFNFATLGINTYTIVVVASGTAGVSSSSSIDIDVLSTYEPPIELRTKLYGFDPDNANLPSSKTWRIKAESSSHFGLGPPPGNPDLQNVFGQWFSAPANDKAGVGMYNDRYVFNSDGTFVHITDNTNDNPATDITGDVFGRTIYIGELGSTGGSEDGADTLNLPYDDYTENWFLTAPAGVETINLTGLAFIGYYTGTHNYEIFDRGTPNELVVRIPDANNEFYWWLTLISE